MDISAYDIQVKRATIFHAVIVNVQWKEWERIAKSQNYVVKTIFILSHNAAICFRINYKNACFIVQGTLINW